MSEPEVTVETILAAPELARIAPGLKAVIRNAIGIRTGDPSSSDLPVGRSKFGGMPDLPERLTWPVFQAEEVGEAIGQSLDGPKEMAIPMVAQIRLSEVAPFDAERLLPQKGWLWFFTDLHGIYKEYGLEAMYAGAWWSKVLFCPDEDIGLSRRESPAELPADRPWKARALQFLSEPTLPHYETCWVPEGKDGFIEMTAEEGQTYSHLIWQRMEGSPRPHRLLGFNDDSQPYVLENGFERARLKLFPEMSAWETFSNAEQYRQLRKARLLLQVVSEDDMSFGRWGSGIFCMFEDDLAKRRFDRTWFWEA